MFDLNTQFAKNYESKWICITSLGSLVLGLYCDFKTGNKIFGAGLGGGCFPSLQHFSLPDNLMMQYN